MKNILLFAFVMLLLSGCNINNQKQKNQERQDSLARVEKRKQDSIARIKKRKQEIEDSLRLIRIDSLALIAWGDAKFGMSKKEVLSTNAFKGSNVYNSSISMNYKNEMNFESDNNLKIGINIEAIFKMDELFRIEIKSTPTTASYIDDLEKDAKRISQKFTEKYGKPEYSFDKEINVFDFNEGEEFRYKSWYIGGKAIYIQFGEKYSGSKYYYSIVIVNSKFPTKEDPEQAKKLQEQDKEKKEREKYQF